MSRKRTSWTKLEREEQTEIVGLTEQKKCKSENELTGEDWRDTKTAGQCVNHLYLSAELSDICFAFKDDPDVKLPAHKFVLSMRSSVFKAMFYGPLAERGSTVLVEDVKPDAMKVLLRFIYSDSPELNGHNVLSCLYAAKKYCLQGLIEKCSTFLENNIDADNVCTIHKQAVFYDMKPLQQNCFGFILDNASDVFMSKSFLEISHDTLVSLLKCDELSEEEENVFSACMKWAKNKCKLDNIDPSAETLRETLGDALCNIRFPAMSMTKFATLVTPTEILTSADQIMLYQHFATNGSSPLDKFTRRERTGKVVTVDVTKYIEGDNNGCQLGVCLEFQLYPVGSQWLHNKVPTSGTAVRVKSVTGKFVSETILVENKQRENFENVGFSTNGSKLTFERPIHVTDGCCIAFEVNGVMPPPGIISDAELSKHMSLYINGIENVHGETIHITQIPYGLQSITFTK